MLRKNTKNTLENRIRVGAVSYLNTKPLLYGLERSDLIRNMDLSLNYPAEVARQLIQNEIDIGLVPVAIIPELKEYFIDADYCIGANGAVASVAIYCEVPIEQVTTLLLDYQSRTSVALARILVKHYWKVCPRLVASKPGYLQDIGGTVAGVVIGDRAFAQKKKSAFEYDLAEAWKNWTGLPFVFAAWVANKELPEDFIAAFNYANQQGLWNLEAVIAENSSPDYDLMTYYTQNISYRLDEAKRMGLKKYLGLLAELPDL